ncbi:MAG: 50S ribosomal protein L1 [Candidatus Woesearchaeota archaeon]
MDKTKIQQALHKAIESSKKRKFKQTFDFIIKLRDLDLKKQDQQIDFFALLHYTKGKKVKVCALVGPEMADAAKQAVDKVVLQDQFPEYSKDKKLAKKLASEYDYFIAQANIMPQIATHFGKVFGIRGKMPNPKAGCVVPPNANLKALYERLQKTVRVRTKNALALQLPVGTEGQPEEEVIDNILTIYSQVVNHLPNHENNISKLFLKMTMGKIVEIK